MARRNLALVCWVGGTEICVQLEVLDGGANWSNENVVWSGVNLTKLAKRMCP